MNTRLSEPTNRRTLRAMARFAAPFLAVLALLALSLLSPVAQAQTQTQVWSATLTVRDLGSSILGCSNETVPGECRSTSNLSDDDFTHASTDYEVHGLFVRSNGQLELILDTDIATGSEMLILDVVGTQFAFKDADLKSDNSRRWSSSGLSWSDGDSVAVKLLETETSMPTIPAAAQGELWSATMTAGPLPGFRDGFSADPPEAPWTTRSSTTWGPATRSISSAPLLVRTVV